MIARFLARYGARHDTRLGALCWRLARAAVNGRIRVRILWARLFS